MWSGDRQDLDLVPSVWDSISGLAKCEIQQAGRQTARFLLSLSVQSLDWETFEQYCAWQLFLAHNIPLETIIPILQHLKYKGE